MLKKINLGLLTTGGIIGALAWHKLAQPSAKNNELTIKNQVPTVFIHGYAGTRLSAGLMIKRFESYGWGQKSAVITIKADGTLAIKGDPAVPGALIQVLFDSNRMSVMHQTNWLWRLMNCLNNHHSIEHVNVIAHSMGGVSVLNYLSKYGSSNQVSHVDKVVTLGVPFNDQEVGHASSTKSKSRFGFATFWFPAFPTTTNICEKRATSFGRFPTSSAWKSCRTTLWES